MTNRIRLNEDIFAHIAAHLTQRQLLSFSRASKATRRASVSLLPESFCTSRYIEYHPLTFACPAASSP